MHHLSPPPPCPVLANGRLQCVGSTMFLKERYGVGFVLSVVKAIAPAASPSVSALSPKSAASGSGGAFATDVAAIVAIVTQHVPTATVSSDVGQELQIRLPLGAVAAFPALFQVLEVRW